MGLRHWMKKLERNAREGHLSFELLDGSTYLYDPREAALELYAYGVAQDVDLGQVEFYRLLKRAKDPLAAIQPLRPRSSDPDHLWLDPIVLAEEIVDARETHGA